MHHMFVQNGTHVPNLRSIVIIIFSQGNGVVVSSEIESQRDGSQCESGREYYSLIVGKQGSQGAAGGVEEVGEVFGVVGEAEDLKDQVLSFHFFS